MAGNNYMPRSVFTMQEHIGRLAGRISDGERIPEEELRSAIIQAADDFDQLFRLMLVFGHRTMRLKLALSAISNMFWDVRRKKYRTDLNPDMRPYYQAVWEKVDRATDSTTTEGSGLYSDIVHTAIGIISRYTKESALELDDGILFGLRLERKEGGE